MTLPKRGTVRRVRLLDFPDWITPPKHLPPGATGWKLAGAVERVPRPRHVTRGDWTKRKPRAPRTGGMVLLSPERASASCALPGPPPATGSSSSITIHLPLTRRSDELLLMARMRERRAVQRGMTNG
jgi:hypothetical protein